VRADEGFAVERLAPHVCEPGAEALIARRIIGAELDEISGDDI
jgi:hypothetical protein